MSIENIVVLKDSHGKVEPSRQIAYYIKNNTLKLRTGEKLLSKFNQELQADRMYRCIPK